MLRNLKIVILLASIPLFGVLVSGAFQTSSQTKVQTAGQKFKNIKVLKDMPADELGKVMNIMSSSLGVNCSFCHTGDDFAKDGNEHKDIAREMIAMTFDLNKKYFAGATEVSCHTCHQGKAHPNSITPYIPPAPARKPTDASKTKPTVDQIFENYVKALGGKDAIAKIKTRYIKAQRVEPSGEIEPEEVFYKAPDRMLATTAYGKYIVAEAYDGKKVWKTGDNSAIILKPDEAEQILREAQLFQPVTFKSAFSQTTFSGTEKLNGSDVNVIRATSISGSRERLYFDAVTGLLVRRTTAIPTVLGDFTVVVDYDDYKDFDGVKIPTTTRWSMPAISWTRKVLEMKNNLPIEDSKFNAVN